MRIGPLEVELRRREQPIKEYADSREAFEELGRALLDTSLGRALERTVAWLDARLRRG